MTAQRARVAEGGRLVIPAEFRRALALNPGESVGLDIRDGELRGGRCATRRSARRPWCVPIWGRRHCRTR